MLLAYIDDSESRQEPQFMVLAGYIASAENWASFADDWYEALQVPPCFNPFKIKDVLKQRHHFGKKTKEECDVHIARFRQVIEKHLVGEFAVGFRLDEYERGFARNTPVQAMKNPFYFAAQQLLLKVARNLEGFGLQREPTDFIYDNREKEKAKLIDAWDWARAKSTKPDPPDLFSRILRNPPSFADDEDVLPLQAADMLVTWVRYSMEVELQGGTLGRIPGFQRQLPGSFLTWDERQFREQALRDAEHARNNP